MANGKVILVGAGPGDPELATVRAVRRLGEADLLLYDALAHPALLEHCSDECERVFVGKRAGRINSRQDEINRKMIEAARAGRTVVRLKGGDPYLFGRGSEEAEALAEAGIPFEVVPGVPSPLAATAYAGISLSHRELASSIAYITATESPLKDASSHDWSKLATATQTLVIFMGVRKLDGLMRLLVEHGRPASTPVAVIQWASMPQQRTVVGTVGDIAERVRAEGIGMPALTVVGEVVRLRDKLRWFDRKPLFGRRVLVTRPLAQSPRLAAALRDAGAEPIALPAIRIQAPRDPEPLAQAAREAASYDWVLFTSENGVRFFFDEVARQGGDARRLGQAQVGVIGPATAAALRERGIVPDAMPSEHRGEALADAVTEAHPNELSGARVLLVRATVARDALPNLLRERGAHVDVVPAYLTTGAAPEVSAKLAETLKAGELDAVTFTSSSTVEHTVAALGERATELLARSTVASIGPITTDTARRLGVRVDVTASKYTTAGLVAALEQHLASAR
jgi:uroporphyrinogen III methyltransferase/synthase